MDLASKLLNIEPVDLFKYKDQVEHFRKLEATNQDKGWHAEGNVLIHTNMVLEKAYQICQTIPVWQERVQIYLGSMLHDFGKPFSTFVNEKSGRTVAYGHESVGTSYAREFLKTYFPMVQYFEREAILSLVEFHGHPKRLIKNEAEDLSYKRLSHDVNTEHVYHVEVADFTGRTGESPETALRYLEEFKKKCEDLRIWGGQAYPSWSVLHDKLTQPWPNEFKAAIVWLSLFGNLPDSNLDSARRVLDTFSKPDRSHLIIPIGAPGSGKTTFLNNHYSNYNRVSMDEERVRLCGDMSDMSRNQEAYDNCFAQLRTALKHGKNVVWDATNVNRKLRRRLRQLAINNGTTVTMIMFDLDLKTCLERNAGRDRHVPEAVIEKYYRDMQAPKKYEYDHLMIVDETDEPNTRA